MVVTLSATLLAQFDKAMAEQGYQIQRIPLWRMLRQHREKLLQLCTLLTPSYDHQVLLNDLEVFRNTQGAIQALHDWSHLLKPKDLTHQRPQAAPVFHLPHSHAHGWNFPEDAAVIAARSEREILTALSGSPNVALVELCEGEAVCETTEWRICIAKRNQWELLQDIQVVREGILLENSVREPFETFKDLLRHVWHACALRHLSRLKSSEMPNDPHLTVRFMPNATECIFLDNGVCCVRLCFDEDYGLRCETEGVRMDISVWDAATGKKLLEEFRERRLAETREAFLEECKDLYFSPEEVAQTEDGVVLRFKESPMEVRIELASTYGHLTQENGVSLLRIITSGWTAPGFDDLRTKECRQKAMLHARRGAFLAGILQECREDWIFAHDPVFEQKRTVVTLVRKSEKVRSGHFTFECVEWGIRNARAVWSPLDFALPLESKKFALTSCAVQLGKQFWQEMNVDLKTVGFDEWDAFLSEGKQAFRYFKHVGANSFSWEGPLQLYFCKPPLVVQAGGVSGSVYPAKLKRPPKCTGDLVHRFPSAVFTVQGEKFTYKGDLTNFFYDMRGLQAFLDAISRAGVPKKLWDSKEYCLSFPEEEKAPAIIWKPNALEWEKPFVISSALEMLLKSKGVPDFVKARRQWGPLAHALSDQSMEIPFVVCSAPPALVWYFPVHKTSCIGAVFSPGHVMCWTKFAPKRKVGFKVYPIPHLGVDEVIGKLAVHVANIPSIVSYLKSYQTLQMIQAARSRRQLKQSQFPPSVVGPSFTCTICEEGEDDNAEFGLYFVDFTCYDEQIRESAFELWEKLQEMRSEKMNIACVHFLNFIDMVKETALLEQHSDDVFALMEGKVSVDWVSRPPEAEKKEFTVLKFYVETLHIVVQYKENGITAYCDGEVVPGHFDRIEDIASSVLDNFDPVNRSKRLKLEEAAE